MNEQPLTLMHAKTTWESGTGSPDFLVTGKTWGYIDVANIAPTKDVVVYYSNNDTPWTIAHATFLASTCNNRETWRFAFTNTTHGDRARLSTEFSVKYEADGRVFWDNNNRCNYHTDTGGYGEPELIVLIGSNVFVDQFLIENGTFTGRIIVKNLAQDKAVKVRYTTDNWTTFNDLDAHFLTANGGHDTWTFSTSVDKNAKVHFAVCYCVSGQTHWDNNFGQNYYVTAT